MFVRGCVFGLTLFGLAGCEQVVGRVAGISGSSDATQRGIRTLSLLGGDARARGPEGYCIDQAASNARRGFTVMAGCALLTDSVAVMPRLDGLITVQFGDEGTASVAGNEDAFASFLNTETGRSLLASGGDAATLSEVTTLTDRSGVLVRFEDTSGPLFAGTQQAQWRGFLDINGRMATVSVLSFERAPLSRSEAQRLLIVTMSELIAVNATPQPEEENTET